MNKYTINSECGVAYIEACSIEQAKEQYSRDHHYDFDSYDDYPGSWYFIEKDGVRVEDCTECMP